MTYAEREKIFSKEVLTTAEIAQLLDMTLPQASTIVTSIKRKSDRLKMRGKVHVQDYLDYFKIADLTRYKKPLGEKPRRSIMEDRHG